MNENDFYEVDGCFDFIPVTIDGICYDGVAVTVSDAKRIGDIKSQLKARPLLEEMDAWFEEYTKYKEALNADTLASETELKNLLNRIVACVGNLGETKLIVDEVYRFPKTYNAIRQANSNGLHGEINVVSGQKITDLLNRIDEYVAKLVVDEANLINKKEVEK